MSQHLRFETTHGPIHVYVPDGYSGGGTVVYVHGFFDTVDTAWEKQRLEAQFDASGRNALFIAVEAQQNSADSVKWRSLSELLDTVGLLTGIRPGDPVVAIAHSGGFETVAAWLTDPRLVHVILLDALYGFVTQYTQWANQPGHTFTLLVTKSGAPRTNAEGILSKLAGLVQKAGTAAISGAERTAKTLFVLANQSHFQLVEPQPGPASSWVIPTMLSRSPLGATGSLPGGLIAVVGLGLILFGFAISRRG